jgi:hypothetical protein
MGNAEITELREFGTGLRDYLQLHGVSLEFRADPPSNADLLVLCAVTTQRPPSGALTFQTASMAA